MMSHDEHDNQHAEQPEPSTPAAKESAESDLHRELRPEDQARVDGFLKRGVNSVERKPFKPLHLLVILVLVVLGLSVFSQWLAHQAGVF